jgi:Zn-dependent oligopeptidase
LPLIASDGLPHQVRESLYRAFVTRAGEANAPLIVEILRLREEQARMHASDCLPHL